MCIREFELFHGAVLTKILRSEKPVSLRLIETRPGESWSTYTLNDSVDLLITHSKHQRPVSQNGGGFSWSFTFSQNQIRQMDSASSSRRVWVAMVCARKSSEEGDMHVCLLKPEEIYKVINFRATQQSLTIRKPNGRKQLRVYKDRKEQFPVPQSRLDNWEVPGA
jgi:hypothetical protein